MKIIIIFAIFWLSVNSLQTNTSVDPLQSIKNYRLNKDVLPEHYNLEITPYFAKEGEKNAFTFDGFVQITLKTDKPEIRSFELHILDLQVESWSLKTLQDVEIIAGTFNPTTYDQDTQKWTINIPQTLIPGTSYIFTVKYTGHMRENMLGFYRSYYYEGSVKKWLASTQFQQTEARRCFPNFDEPGFKSSFKLRINRPASFGQTLSNTNLETAPYFDPNYPNRIVDQFKVTPVMSSYILTFIISEYKGRQSTDGTFGVFASPPMNMTINYGFEFGQKNLKALGDYLEYNYYDIRGIEKMDTAAIPDFTAGAMEGYGLMTFRESSILYDASASSLLTKQRIAQVFSHEAVHQWFGNLVTCEWWSFTWLNEAFARYFQYFGTALVEQSWSMDQQFVVDQMQTVFQLDATAGTHPMTHDVNTPTDANFSFDTIAYSKGAVVMRMLEIMIGKPSFQALLRDYIKENEEKTVTPDDLYISLRKVTTWSPQNFTNLINSWTNTSGFPLVTASIFNKTLLVSQKRFMYNKDHSDTTLYSVPITMAFGGGSYDTDNITIRYLRVTDGAGVKRFPLVDEPTDYFILNVQQSGYYRVNYDADNWALISNALRKNNHDGIHVLNRAQIVDDLMNLARPGIVEYNEAFEIIEYLKDEYNYIPWVSAFNALNFLAQRMPADEDQKLFGWYVLHLIENVYNKLTFYPLLQDTHLDKLLRMNLISWACKYGHEDCIKNSLASFKGFIERNEPVHQDYRAQIYCNGIRAGSQADFMALLQKYESAFAEPLLASEQLNMLQGLACTMDESLLKIYLDKLLLGDLVRQQDKSSVFYYALNANPKSYLFLFNHIIMNRLKWLNLPYDEHLQNQLHLATALLNVAGRFYMQEEIERLLTFGSATTNGPDLNLSLEGQKIANANIEWNENYIGKVREYFKLKKNSAPISIKISFFALVTAVLVYLI